MRSFFFLQAIGHLCRLQKIVEDTSQDNLVIEGILESCDATSGHLILAQAVILKVFGDPYNQNSRSELVRRADRASIAMDEVKECRFTGLSIGRDGIKIIENYQEPAVA